MKYHILKFVMWSSLVVIGYMAGVWRGSIRWMETIATDRDTRATVRVWIDKIDRGEIVVDPKRIESAMGR